MAGCQPHQPKEVSHQAHSKPIGSQGGPKKPEDFEILPLVFFWDDFISQYKDSY